MGQRHTSPHLKNHTLAASDTHMRIDGRLQCFVDYADDSAGNEGPIAPVTIHQLSPRRVITQSVADLRIGAIVRLRIPRLGWRHLEVRWISRSTAGYTFLLPLQPYELRAVLDRTRIGQTIPPAPRRRTPASSLVQKPQSISRRVRRRSSWPSVTDLGAAGQALVGAVLRLLSGSPFAPHRGASITV